MEQHLQDALQIRYIKLHFTLTVLEDTKLPADKVSALRGGMGEMLLRMNCVRDRRCRQCDFEQECVVYKTLYSCHENSPCFVTGKDSIGYILECGNYEEAFSAGDQFSFHLILFGKTIVYFNLYMQAFFALGMEGIGRYHSRFQIASVTNTNNQQLLAGNSIYMKYFQIQTISGYVSYRMKQMREEGCENKMIFQTPLALKYQDAFLDCFHMEAVWNAVRRRIYMLESYENIAPDIYHCDRLEEISLPEIVRQSRKTVRVKRYSSTQDQKIVLRGMKGTAVLDCLPEPVLQVLLAGELTHIGKNTSFGFGKYRIV